MKLKKYSGSIMEWTITQNYPVDIVIQIKAIFTDKDTSIKFNQKI